MRTASTLLLGLALAGCPARPPVPAGPPPGHPDLVCPPGSLAAGWPPPRGSEVWCERPTPSGPIREGPSIAFHEDGAVSARGDFVDGRPNGRWDWWYPTGQAAKSGGYVLGAEEGPWTTWHPGGRVASRGVYVSGREEGPWEFFDEHGARFSGAYRGGLRVGTWVQADASGAPRQQQRYVDGRLVSVDELPPGAAP